MAAELSEGPPKGVEYSFVDRGFPRTRWIRSPIKGFLGYCDSDSHDIIEAVISPVYTRNRWVYSLATAHEATAFSLLGLPLPRSVRAAFISRLLLRDNCKRVTFWSAAGRETLREAGFTDDRVHRKAEVVYPAVRTVPKELVRFHDSDIHILFSGDFFRKGGANVVDAFERAQQRYRGISLRICSDEASDFRTSDLALKNEYLARIRGNRGIVLGRVPRAEMIANILPETDVYLLPTYIEAFGFAVLEAMAYGIPVIATNFFAIPEMLQHGVSGFLIDTSAFGCERLFKGYVVNRIPDDFRTHVTEELFRYLCALIESRDLRVELGSAARDVARTKFSLEQRNRRMAAIYEAAMA